jgi:hypothetical protein
MGLAYTFMILYDAQGHTGNTYYWRAVRKSDGHIFDRAHGTVVANPTWDDSVTLLVEDGVTGAYPVNIPAALPVGDYDLIIYHQAGSTPANTDDVETSKDLINGSVFGF